MQRGNDGAYAAEVPLDARGVLYQLEVRAGEAAALIPNVLKTRPYWLIDACAGVRPETEREETITP